MSLKIKSASECHYDQISLGEVMLRLDPGEGRIRTARQFAAWEGGGEYNTSRGLRKCFGLRTAVCTALVDNEVGHLIEDFIMQGGVDTEFIKWREDDGIGRSVRNGLDFTERDSESVVPWATPTEETAPLRNSNPATTTGITFSANSASAGSTPAVLCRSVRIGRAGHDRSRHGRQNTAPS
jgi:hypothetical protein